MSENAAAMPTDKPEFCSEDTTNNASVCFLFNFKTFASRKAPITAMKKQSVTASITIIELILKITLLFGAVLTATIRIRDRVEI